MFSNPMWLDEVQRIGFMKCSPQAYRLHGLADLVGFLSFLVFISMFVLPFLVTAWASLYAFIAVIVLMAIRVLIYSRACAMVDSKGFKYDYEKRISSWSEDGQHKTYTYEDFKMKAGA